MQKMQAGYMLRDAKQAFRLNVDIRYIKSFVIIDHMVISKGAVKKTKKCSN